MGWTYGILSRINSAGLAALGVAACVGLASPAYADPPPPSGGNDTMTITVLQGGADVTMSFTGAIDTNVLTFVSATNAYSAIASGSKLVTIGGSIFPAPTNYDNYLLSQPSFAAAFNSGSLTFPNSVTGSVFLTLGGTAIGVPSGYTSGTTISGSSTYSGETLSQLGLNVGTYTQNYGTNDKIVLNIETAIAVPEPASLALLAAGLAGVGAVRRRKR